MTDRPDVVVANQVTKVFRDGWGRSQVTAVAGLDLTIGQGEVVGLLGPNGSGKSTTVKLLLDLLHPTSGDIRIFGRPPGEVATKARIGYLPEESHLYPYLTGEETLDFFGRLLGLDPAARRERSAQLLEMVRLSAGARRRAGQYSKGMQRRLGLAQALLNDPDLLILDEPTSGLDPLGIREVKDLLRHLADRGKTILLCSHLLSEVEDVCDRVQILYQGRTLATGSLAELLAEPDRLVFAVPAVAPGVAAQVAAILTRELDGAEVTWARPRRTLESFFIEIVEAARQGDPDQVGVAPYLRADTSDA